MPVCAVQDKCSNEWFLCLLIISHFLPSLHSFLPSSLSCSPLLLPLSSVFFLSLPSPLSSHPPLSSLSPSLPSLPPTATATECSPEEFTCVTSHSCVPLLFKCDTEEDCLDGSDEDNCCECDAHAYVRMYIPLFTTCPFYGHWACSDRMLMLRV